MQNPKVSAIDGINGRDKLFQVDEPAAGIVRWRQEGGRRPAGAVGAVAPGDAAQVDGIEQQRADVEVFAAGGGRDLLGDVRFGTAGRAPHHGRLAGLHQQGQGVGKLTWAQRVVGGDSIGVGHNGLQTRGNRGANTLSVRPIRPGPSRTLAPAGAMRRSGDRIGSPALRRIRPGGGATDAREPSRRPGWISCAAATGPPGRLAWGIFAPPLTPKPGSGESTSAAWPAVPALRAPPAKPPECDFPPIPYRFARSSRNPTRENKARSGVKAGRPEGVRAVSRPFGVLPMTELDNIAAEYTAPPERARRHQQVDLCVQSDPGTTHATIQIHLFCTRRVMVNPDVSPVALRQVPPRGTKAPTGCRSGRAGRQPAAHPEACSAATVLSTAIRSRSNPTGPSKSY